MTADDHRRVSGQKKATTIASSLGGMDLSVPRSGARMAKARYPGSPMTKPPFTHENRADRHTDLFILPVGAFPHSHVDLYLGPKALALHCGNIGVIDRLAVVQCS
jgi:hypothetical protein